MVEHKYIRKEIHLALAIICLVFTIKLSIALPHIKSVCLWFLNYQLVILNLLAWHFNFMAFVLKEKFEIDYKRYVKLKKQYLMMQVKLRKTYSHKYDRKKRQ